MAEKTVFHVSELFDYQGRPWCSPQARLKAEEAGVLHETFIPKKFPLSPASSFVFLCHFFEVCLKVPF